MPYLLSLYLSLSIYIYTLTTYREAVACGLYQKNTDEDSEEDSDGDEYEDAEFDDSEEDEDMSGDDKEIDDEESEDDHDVFDDEEEDIEDDSSDDGSDDGSSGNSMYDDDSDDGDSPTFKMPSVNSAMRQTARENIKKFYTPENTEVAACACCDEDFNLAKLRSHPLSDEVTTKLTNLLTWQHYIPEGLRRQYRLPDPRLQTVPLSPRGFTPCSDPDRPGAINLCYECNRCLSVKSASAMYPPPLSIANDWATGELLGDLATATWAEIRMCTPAPVSGLIKTYGHSGKGDDAYVFFFIRNLLLFCFYHCSFIFVCIP